MTIPSRPFKHLRAGRDKVSASEYNRLVDLLAKISNSFLVSGLMDSTGFHTSRQPFVPAMDIRIFEVQSAATGDGLYTCYQQKLDATNWANEGGLDKLLDFNTTEVIVLNLNENDPVEGTYAAALATKDRIAAWQWTDDEGNRRWVGIPLVPSPRRARTTAAAGAATTIACNLISNEGIELAAGLGSNITVNCNISGGGNLDSCIRRLANDDYLNVEWQAGKWYATEGFQTISDGLVIDTELKVNIDTDHFQFDESTPKKLQDKLDTCPLG